MAKAAMVQARIDIDLKHKADQVLSKIGVTASQAINALYAQIVLQKGIPFDLKIPNEKTIAAMQELERGGGKHFDSFDAMMNDLD